MSFLNFLCETTVQETEGKTSINSITMDSNLPSHRWILRRFIHDDFKIQMKPLDIHLSEDGGVYIFGRDVENPKSYVTQKLKGENISREHFQMTFRHNHWFAHDLKSRNGTFIMKEIGVHVEKPALEKRPKEKRVKEGEYICLGATKIGEFKDHPIPAETYIFKLIREPIRGRDRFPPKKDVKIELFTIDDDEDEVVGPEEIEKDSLYSSSHSIAQHIDETTSDLSQIQNPPSPSSENELLDDSEIPYGPVPPPTMVQSIPIPVQSPPMVQNDPISPNVPIVQSVPIPVHGVPPVKSGPKRAKNGRFVQNVQISGQDVLTSVQREPVGQSGPKMGQSGPKIRHGGPMVQNVPVSVPDDVMDQDEKGGGDETLKIATDFLASASKHKRVSKISDSKKIRKSGKSDKNEPPRKLKLSEEFESIEAKRLRAKARIDSNADFEPDPNKLHSSTFPEDIDENSASPSKSPKISNNTEESCQNSEKNPENAAIIENNVNIQNCDANTSNTICDENATRIVVLNDKIEAMDTETGEIVISEDEILAEECEKNNKPPPPVTVYLSKKSKNDILLDEIQKTNEKSSSQNHEKNPAKNPSKSPPAPPKKPINSPPKKTEKQLEIERKVEKDHMLTRRNSNPVNFPTSRLTNSINPINLPGTSNGIRIPVQNVRPSTNLLNNLPKNPQFSPIYASSPSHRILENRGFFPMSPKSPSYGNRTPGYGGKSPSYGNRTPGYGGKSPSYGNRTPGYGGKSPYYEFYDENSSNSSSNSQHLTINVNVEQNMEGEQPLASPSCRLEDNRIYRDILRWDSRWIEEISSTRKLPILWSHITKAYSNVTIYKDYETYYRTFYNLIILELWHSIVCSYMKFKSHPHGNFKIKAQLLNAQSMDISPFSRTKTPTGPDYWTIFDIFVDSELCHDFDYVIIRLNFQVNAPRIDTRSYFAYVMQFEKLIPQSPPNEAQDPLRLNQGTSHGTKIRVLAHLKDGLKYLFPQHGLIVEKVGFIGSFIRESQALHDFQQSPLFNIILDPLSHAPPQNYIDSTAVIHPQVQALNLNEDQSRIVMDIFNRVTNFTGPDLMMIHGYAGTGKTTTIAALLLQILNSQANSKSKMRILVSAPTLSYNTNSIDDILQKFDEFTKGDESYIGRVVRVGHSQSPSKHHNISLKKYRQTQIKKSLCSPPLNPLLLRQRESLIESISRIEDKIRAARENEMQMLKRNLPSERTLIERLRTEIQNYVKDKDLYKTDLAKMQRSDEECNSSKFSLSSAEVIFSPLSTSSLGVPPSFFHLSIIDEATTATEPSSLLAINSLTPKLLLVGDPNLLSPPIGSKVAEGKKYKKGLFRRVGESWEEGDKDGETQSPIYWLRKKMRMGKEAGAWVNEWFNRSDGAGWREDELTLMTKNYAVIDGRVDIGPETQQTVISMIVEREVDILTSVLNVLKDQGTVYEEHRKLSIGIITPHETIAKKISSVIAHMRVTCKSFVELVEVGPVETFMSREKDIIIFSSFTTNREFLSEADSGKLNLALTRAKHSLIVLINSLDRKNDAMLSTLISDASYRGLLFPVPENYKKENDKYLTKWVESAILHTN